MDERKIAVLMTCYNRKDTTLRCLETLYAQVLPVGMKMDIFLVDDGSPDQTGRAVKGLYPQVHIIEGDGSLYWGGGMRLAWDTAAAQADYHFYLWVNDDVTLEKNAIATLFNDSQSVFRNTGKDALISGCVCCPETGQTTYSGNNGGGVLEPTGEPQSVKHNNGNVALIPRSIFQVLGNISKEFSHQLGDGDYGMRCLSAGFGCYVSSFHIGNCEKNTKPVWFDPDIPLRKRLALLHAPTGMKPNERFVFNRRHYGLMNAVLAVIKLYASSFFPRAYSAAKKHFDRQS